VSALPVIFSPEAVAQLESIRAYVADQASPAVANAYVDRILAQCGKLGQLPWIGTPRDDLRPGLRSLSFERRLTILHRIMDNRVIVVALAYGGRDLAKLLI